MKGSNESRKEQKTSRDGYPNREQLETKPYLGVQQAESASESGISDVQLVQTSNLLEMVLERGNLIKAYKQTVGNKGSHGTDQMTVSQLKSYLVANWQAVKSQILSGRYKPTAIRRVEIPKPDGGIRLLGIPTVLDRMIQQAIAQILNGVFDHTFSESSYGFRKGRSAHDAIETARKYISEGYDWVVDIDLERFFDRVNHDKLMALVARRVGDKRLLKLLRRYLESGIMINGIVTSTDDGVPQGGPLSPLLSNIMLDELDKTLEKRGHRFVRYADDCNIYVRSKRAGERVYESIKIYLETKLKLKVNESKSAVSRPFERKFLGFSFYLNKEGVPQIRVHEGSIKRFHKKVKPITARNWGVSMDYRLQKLSEITNGWVNYFAKADSPVVFSDLEKWIRRRLRACLWVSWKKVKTKRKNLIKLGMSAKSASRLASTRKGAWRISKCTPIHRTLTNQHLENLGFKSLTKRYHSVH